MKIDEWILRHENRDQGVMLVTAFADSMASAEGFVQFQRGRSAWKLRYASTADMEADLVKAQEMGIITDLVIGKDMTSLKMLEPADRYQVKGAEVTDDLFGVSATVYAEVMRYWNQIAARNERRLVPTRNAEPSAEQCADIKRAWQNAEFRVCWKRSIRILAVSSFYDGRRVTFKTWIGRNREKTTLFALQSMRIFEEQRPALSTAEHATLYPEPKWWAAEHGRTSPWEVMPTRDRERVYREMEARSKQAI